MKIQFSKDKTKSANRFGILKTLSRNYGHSSLRFLVLGEGLWLPKTLHVHPLANKKIETNSPTLQSLLPLRDNTLRLQAEAPVCPKCPVDHLMTISRSCLRASFLSVKFSLKKK